jgi:hypothetical protein
MASLRAEGIDTLVPVLVWVATVAHGCPSPPRLLEPPAS